MPSLRCQLLSLATFFLVFGPALPVGFAQLDSSNLVKIDASGPTAPPETGFLRMGRKSSSGHEITVNSRYLTLDGKPWLPIMGEFHFSRYPEKYWEEEILKMKAGGLQIVATYIFWIHHEEIEGQFDWTGQRDLRRFAELCRKHDMYLFARIGPWVHGEARNGGLPDWVLKKGPTRRNRPAYLSHVRRFYQEIGKQLQGLMWKDAGPVIGVQLENEYGEQGPDAGSAHIAELKRLAIEAGLDAPIFTVTGWPNLDFPPGELIPAFGGYPDGFWFGSLEELPASEVYLFSVGPPDVPWPGLEKSSDRKARLAHYPYFVAEGGAGMESAYHRRPAISADDVAASMLTRLGSGANLHGYYMFHGGANPQGKLSTLQESSATDYPNDVPVVSYDFQAPLGEFGQMRPSFRQLKLVHLFTQDFGDSLAPMATILPAVVPKSPADTGPPRLAVRTDGQHAFLFFNNYLRNYPLPVRKGFQLSLKLPSETVVVPNKPIDIPSGAYFIWPVNLEMQGARLQYATSQLVCNLKHAGAAYYFFVALPGIDPQFVFENDSVELIDTPGAKVSRADGRTYIDGLNPGTSSAITVRSRDRNTVHIVLLSQEQARNLWKTSLANREYIFLSPADVFFGDGSLHLRSRDVNNLRFGVFPNLDRPSSAQCKKSGTNGLFFEYAASVYPKGLSVDVEAVRTEVVPSPVRMGKAYPWRRNVAVAVPPEDYNHAMSWRVSLPKDALNGLSDAFLRISYVGDVARLYGRGGLMDDNFYKGTVWEAGLKRFADHIAGSTLELKILPLGKDAPIYIPKNAWPDFASSNAVGKLQQVEIAPEYEVVTQFGTK